MNSNLKKSGLGKYAGVHGVVFKNDVMPAAPAKGVIGKAGGKTCNMPMDSDAEFEKRVKLSAFAIRRVAISYPQIPGRRP